MFQLHPSFATPLREMLAPPFELTEHGWGEFEIAATVSSSAPDLRSLPGPPCSTTHLLTAPCWLQIHFVPAAGEQPVELLHKLRLYGHAEAGGPANKKPVCLPVHISP